MLVCNIAACTKYGPLVFFIVYSKKYILKVIMYLIMIHFYLTIMIVNLIQYTENYHVPYMVHGKYYKLAPGLSTAVPFLHYPTSHFFKNIFFIHTSKVTLCQVYISKIHTTYVFFIMTSLLSTWQHNFGRKD